MEYKEYLGSEDWADKRRRKLARTNRCGICSAKSNLDVHHLNYRDLVSVELSDLRVLCRRCHYLAHDLHKRGVYRFRSDNHHSRFAILKSAVKVALGISARSMFPLP